MRVATAPDADRQGRLIMRILVVDDAALYRLILAEALSREESIGTVETAADVGAAIDFLSGRVAGTVVLLNMGMLDGEAVLNTVISRVPEVPVIALGVCDQEDDIIACAEAGVAGCLLRDDSYGELLALISSVSRGERRCSPPVAAALLRRVAMVSKASHAAYVRTRLTPREHEVMRLVDAGLSNQQIARRLSIELRTVKNHVHHVLVKLQVHRRTDAVELLRAAPGSNPAGSLLR